MKYNVTNYQSNNRENNGFIATTPPRRAARGREEDILILNIIHSKQDDSRLVNLVSLRQDAVTSFYRSSGSVTNAMRNTVERVDQYLRAKNSGLREDVHPESVSMMVAVIRDDRLYLAQAGYASALLVGGAGTRLFYDTDIPQGGLGVGDLPEIRFFQTDFHGSDFVLLGAPKTMREFMREDPLPSSVLNTVEGFKTVAVPFSLSRISLGSGKIESLQLSYTQVDKAPAVEAAVEEKAVEAEPVAEVVTKPEPVVEPEVKEEPVPETDPQEATQQTVLPFDIEETPTPEESLPAEEVPELEDEPELATLLFNSVGHVVAEEPPEDAYLPEADDSPEEEPEEEEDEGIIDVDSYHFKERTPKTEEAPCVPPVIEKSETPPVYVEEKPGFEPEPEPYHEDPILEEEAVFEEDPVEEEPIVKEPDLAAIERQERLERLKNGALKGIARSAGWLRTVEDKAQVLAHRAEQQAAATGQELPTLSPFAKWAIVILTPLIVVAIAVTIYFARGLDRQYVYYIDQARQAVATAPEIQDYAKQREAWLVAQIWLDKAKAFNQGDNSEMVQIRNQAQAGLDRMDGVRRLVYKNAFGSNVYPDLKITHIVPSNDALFVLDSHSGSVVRFYRSGDTFLLDRKFSCGPGKVKDVEVGPIIDMSAIPVNNPNNATLLAMDAAGTVLYCSEGGKPNIAVKLQDPEGGWGAITAMNYGNDGLYVLDAPNNKIWVYRGLPELFPDPPGAYLDDVNEDVRDGIDLVVRRDGLFLLYRDGKTVWGNIPNFVEFEEPNLNTESASGQGHAGLSLEEVQFRQIADASVGDASVYYLDTKEPAIYRFSSRLAYNEVLKVGFGEQITPMAKASAFGITVSKLAFIAFGGQLYYAQLP